MFKVSHILWRVDNIKEAVDAFRAKGFQVDWARDPKISLNALIWFESGPFIELIQMKAPMRVFGGPLRVFYGKGMSRRWRKWCVGSEGLCDFAVEPIAADTARPENIDAARQWVAERGLGASKAIQGKRTPPDGTQVRFAFFAPDAAALPFVVSAYSLPQKPSQIVHANGATAIGGFTYSAPPDAVAHLKTLIEADTALEVVCENGAEGQLKALIFRGLDDALCSERLHGVQLNTDRLQGERKR